VLPNTGGKLLECLETANPFHGEKLKGEKVTLISNIDPVMEDKKIIGVVSVFQDISEIEDISQELDGFKNMKKWLDAVIDSSYDGLWICDKTGTVIQINKASERIDGVKAGDVVGKNVRDLVAEGILDKSVTLEVLSQCSFEARMRERGGKTDARGWSKTHSCERKDINP
jgi:transcriptional regulator with PAS, ATPase and Fis domain